VLSARRNENAGLQVIEPIAQKHRALMLNDEDGEGEPSRYDEEEMHEGS